MKSLGVLRVAAALFMTAFVLTLLVGPDWIESVLHVQPDGGDGSIEALVIATPAVIALTLATIDILLRRRARPA